VERIYAGEAVEPAAPTFADYAHWEATAGQGKRESERSWWLERFAEVPSPLELPCDFDRPPRLSFDGDEVAIDLSAETGTPLDELVTDLRLARDPSRNPLFDVLFAWEEQELVEVQGSRLGLTEIPAALTPCKFDLELTVQNTPAGQRIALLYATKLFRRTTAE